jgi:hypothetical protein
MTREFDPKKSYLAVKANEKMLAYVGFNIRLEGNRERKEGVVKISSFERAYGGGYLTLTFIVDKGQDATLIGQLEQLCANITEKALEPLLGKEFERMVRVDLDLLEETKSWYVEEINVYFRSIAGREKTLVESFLIPALEKILPCKFETVEWWPEGKDAEALRAKDVSDNMSLRGLFKKWFGSS